ncbi:MAG: mobile mystery protein B [Actinomycetota bacterium]|nr:mobile mystery protein B [Actinomycetota bacterium]MDA8280437.1 mobile mystery protein B [Actinomycetota bacterium]
MTGPAEPPASSGPVGAEPAGATPIDEEDLDGLIADFVATRADLNRVEFENIAAALPDLLRAARSRGPAGVLDYGFLLEVHRRMFCDVWTWAGTLRRRDTNIGVDKSLVATSTMQCLDDARYWHNEKLYDPDELAVRLHARLVAVHPFPNGNGRATRLMADLYLTSIGVDSFSWGSAALEAEGTTREQYLATLVEALRSDDFATLIAFART